ncbi:hypothetical protein Tco_0565377 [Tanacetum coccineum]
MDASGGSRSNSPVWPIVDIPIRRKIPNLDPPVGIFANHLRSLFHCDFVSLDSRLNSKKSTMYHSFGSDEEGDHVRILQSCNGLLMYTGSEWPCFYYVYNPSINLFKRLPQANYYFHDDSGFFRCGVFRLAFDPRKSISYNVELAERRIWEPWIHIYSQRLRIKSFCRDRFATSVLIILKVQSIGMTPSIG